MEVSWWQVGLGLLGSGVSAAALKHFVLDRPKVRLRAAADSVSVARMDPVIEFTLTNVRKDEVNVSPIRVELKRDGETPTHGVLHTKPSKSESFRLQGQERVTFTASWDDIFPDGPGDDDGYGINDLESVYVEIISTGASCKLPAEDIWQIREAIEPTLKYRREKTEWVLTCRSCTKKTSWYARPPGADGGFGFGGLGEESGWTAHEFPRYVPMAATALCPACTAQAHASPKAAG